MVFKNKILRLLPAIFWLLVITVVSGFPGDKVPKVAIWHFDKLVHSGIYLVLTLLILMGFSNYYSIQSNRVKLGVLVVLFGITYGGFMEILQHNIFINRSGNWQDFLANGLGAIIGVFVFPIIKKMLPNIS